MSWFKQTVEFLGFERLEEWLETKTNKKSTGHLESEEEQPNWFTRFNIRKGLRFPLEGETYKALSDTDIRYVIQFRGTSAFEGRGTVRKGEQIIVGPITNPKPKVVDCIPVNYQQLRDRLFPQSFRREEKYDTYYLKVETEAINFVFERLNKPEFVDKSN